MDCCSSSSFLYFYLRKTYHASWSFCIEHVDNNYYMHNTLWKLSYSNTSCSVKIISTRLKQNTCIYMILFLIWFPGACTRVIFCYGLEQNSYWPPHHLSKPTQFVHALMSYQSKIAASCPDLVHTDTPHTACMHAWDMWSSQVDLMHTCYNCSIL